MEEKNTAMQTLEQELAQLKEDRERELAIGEG